MQVKWEEVGSTDQEKWGSQGCVTGIVLDGNSLWVVGVRLEGSWECARGGVKARDVSGGGAG